MMYKPIIYYDFILESRLMYSKQIEVYVDRFPKVPTPISTIRIVILSEPHIISELLPLVQGKKDWYDYVFTYYEPLLQTNDKAVKFIGPQPWVRNYNFPEKEFSVSTVVGGKRMKGLPGHVMRHELWHARHRILVPKKFYLSSLSKYEGADYDNNLVLHGTKYPLFDSMFHIAIENISLQNMFSEKILDCFQAKTVPIYYGAPNIGDDFDIDGILVADSVEDIIKICNELTPKLYEYMLDSIEANYLLSNKWISFNDNLDNTIEKTLTGCIRL